MPINRTNRYQVPPQSATGQVSGIGLALLQSVGSVAASFNDARSQQERDERDRMREQENIERQGFEASIAETMGRYESQDGFDYNGALAEFDSKAANLSTPLGQADFRGRGRAAVFTRHNQDVSKGIAKAVEVNAKMRKINATDYAATLATKFPEIITQVAEERGGVGNVDIIALRDGLAQELIAQQKITDPEAQAAVIEHIGNKLIMAADERGKIEKADRVQAHVTSVVNVFARGIEDEGATVDDLYSVLQAGRDGIRVNGGSGQDISKFSQDAVMLAIRAGKFDKAESLNNRLPEQDQLDAVTMKRERATVEARIRADELEGQTKEYEAQINAASTPSELLEIVGRLPKDETQVASKQDGTPIVKTSLPTWAKVIRNKAEAKNAEMIKEYRDTVFAPVDKTIAAIDKNADESDFSRAEQMLTTLGGIPEFDTLNGPVPAFTEADITPRRMVLASKYAEWEKARAAEKTVEELNQPGRRYDTINVNDPTYADVIMGQIREYQEAGGNAAQYAAELLIEKGALPEKAVDMLAGFMLPQVNAETGEGADAAVTGMQKLQEATLRNGRMGRQIAETSPGGRTKQTLDAMGFNREKVIKTFAKYTPKEIAAAESVAASSEDEIYGDLGFDSPNPLVTDMARAVMTMKLLEQRTGLYLVPEEDKTKKSDFEEYDEESIARIRRAAVAEVQNRIRTVNVLGRSFQIPRGALNYDGTQNPVAFDGVTDQVVESQVMRLIDEPGGIDRTQAENRPWLWANSWNIYLDPAGMEPEIDGRQVRYRVPVFYRNGDDQQSIGWVYLPTNGEQAAAYEAGQLPARN